MTPQRLRKLEARVAALRCPVCGMSGGDDPPMTDLQALAWDERLSAAERAEVEEISARGAHRCARCGRVRYDFSALSAAELDRILELLRRVFPDGGGATVEPDLPAWVEPLATAST